MHPLIQDYLNKKLNEKKEYELKKKTELLLELGLFEKEYTDKNTYSSEYPESEWDSESNTNKYYKKVPVEISDEEYSEILKYQKKRKALTTPSQLFLKF